MTALPKYLSEYLMELIKRGRKMPIKVNNYGKEQIFAGYNSTDGYYTYGELQGLVKTIEDDMRSSFFSGEYTLGYCRALDMFNSEIKVGDTVIIAGKQSVGTVKEVILNPLQLLKITMNADEYKTFYKYDNICRPLVKVHFTHLLQRNEYTDVSELKHLKRGEIKDDYIQASNVIVSAERVKYNVKSHE